MEKCEGQEGGGVLTVLLTLSLPFPSSPICYFGIVRLATTWQSLKKKSLDIQEEHTFNAPQCTL